LNAICTTTATSYREMKCAATVDVLLMLIMLRIHQNSPRSAFTLYLCASCKAAAAAVSSCII
jgi:DNA-directed RNA polymerase subunit RPC12/RpoP